jgi:hypothetical protein
MTLSKRWNLFARTLEEVLIPYQWQIADLEKQIGVHHEKLRRLKQSLDTPKSFPTLNPDELGRLQRALSLTPVEEQRLKAALLTTAIEEMLMDRIHQDQALAIAEQLQPIIESLFANASLQRHLSHVEGNSHKMPDLKESLEPVLGQYDHGMLAWHLSEQALGYDEQVACLKQAQRALQDAEQGLGNLRTQWGKTETWQLWWGELQSALSQVTQHLHDLEA